MNITDYRRDLLKMRADHAPSDSEAASLPNLMGWDILWVAGVSPPCVHVQKKIFLTPVYLVFFKARSLRVGTICGGGAPPGGSKNLAAFNM